MRDDTKLGILEVAEEVRSGGTAVAAARVAMQGMGLVPSRPGGTFSPCSAGHPRAGGAQGRCPRGDCPAAAPPAHARS